MEDFLISMAFSTIFHLVKWIDPDKMMKFGPALVKLRDRLVAIYPLETFPAGANQIFGGVVRTRGKPEPPTP